MTKKLYYDDGACISAQACVRACEALAEGGYRVLLDQSAIYPEGGGQPSDTGYIDTLRVSEAREEGEEIWHYTDGALEVGRVVRVRADAQRRRDHSQQHSGEHIVSGLASRLFQAKNVGFHMAAGYSTLDLDKALSDEEMRLLERESNLAVQANLPVRYEYVQAEALSGIKLRKQAKGLEGEVRIVYIGEVDSCTCCGTHVAATGEIGYIYFVNWQHYKGGVRLWFLCGMRAAEAAGAQRDMVESLARRYSVKREDLQSAVEKQMAELASLKFELKNKTSALLEHRAESALKDAKSIRGAKLVIEKLSGAPMAELKLLADKLLAKERCVAMLFSQCEETLYYQLASSKDVPLSMRELCAAVNAATGGKGGGRDDFAQGSAKKQSGFAETLAQLAGYTEQKMAEKQ